MLMLTASTENSNQEWHKTSGLLWVRGILGEDLLRGVVRHMQR